MDQPKIVPAAQFDVFERATEIMAMWLALFREDESEPNENDKLTAGHLAGALWANGLLAGELPPSVGGLVG